MGSLTLYQVSSSPSLTPGWTGSLGSLRHGILPVHHVPSHILNANLPCCPVRSNLILHGSKIWRNQLPHLDGGEGEAGGAGLPEPPAVHRGGHSGGPLPPPPPLHGVVPGL